MSLEQDLDDVRKSVAQKITIEDQRIEVSLQIMVGEQEYERMIIGSTRGLSFQGDLNVEEKDFVRRRLFETCVQDVVSQGHYASEQFNRRIVKWPQMPGVPAEPTHGKVKMESVKSE